MISTIKDESNIIFFDGVCNLCNFWVNYVIRNDPDEFFCFTSLQSDFASSFLKQNKINSDFETIILYSEGKFFKESDAIISILYKIRGFNRVLSILIKLIPLKIRNSLYRFISRNRYPLFGRRDHCMVPSHNIKNRFL